MPSLEKKDLRICSLHFQSESFKLFSKTQRRLHDYAVPVRDLFNWALHKPPSSASVDTRSADFTSPPDFSAHSLLSPVSPHVNTHALKHYYGSKSRRGLFTSIPSVFTEMQDTDHSNIIEGPSLEEASSGRISFGVKRSYSAKIEKSSDETARKKMRWSTSTPENYRQRHLDNNSTSYEGHSIAGHDNARSQQSLSNTLLCSLSSPQNNIFNTTGSSSADKLAKQRNTVDARIKKLKESVAKKNRIINKLRMQVARARRPKSSTLTAKEVVTAAKPFLRPTMQILLEAQVKLSACKKKGMRWSNEMKDFTLGLMYHGPRCYRYLSKLIPLPSVSTINRYQSLIPLQIGIHEHVKVCLIEKVKTWANRQKMCTLIIDEMSIQRHLEYDAKRDFVHGFCDDGSNRKQVLASRGIVAAFKGIMSPWKQIIGHWFTADTDQAEVVYKAVWACVALANEAGLILKLVVCDQDSKNRKLCNLLGISPDKPYFMNGVEKVFFFWDPPHLIKSIRNNLLQHDFKWRGQVVSWRYIKAIYFAQQKYRLKLTPKLTRRHIIFKSSFSKMKVKLATQVFFKCSQCSIDDFRCF